MRRKPFILPASLLLVAVLASAGVAAPDAPPPRSIYLEFAGST